MKKTIKDLIDDGLLVTLHPESDIWAKTIHRKNTSRGRHMALVFGYRQVDEVIKFHIIDPYLGHNVQVDGETLARSLRGHLAPVDRLLPMPLRPTRLGAFWTRRDQTC